MGRATLAPGKGTDPFAWLLSRAGLLCLGLAIVAAIALATASAAPAATPPPQGMYENCDLPTHEDECLLRLDEMHSAGIEVVINYWSWGGTLEQELEYADHAAALGMQLIWPIAWNVDDPATAYPGFAQDCDCTGPAVLDYAVSAFRDHPATWGYYVGEELSPPGDPAMSQASEQVRQLDPNHPRLYVGWGGANPTANLTPFTGDADVIAADYYPIGLGRSIGDTTPIAADVQRLAASSGTEPGIVLQAFNWADEPTLAPPGEWRWPTSEEMRRMRDLAYLEGDFRIMLWFDYYFVKPLGTTSLEHLDALAAAISAPYPVRVERLQCFAGRLTWKQSRPGRVFVRGWRHGRRARLAALGRSRLSVRDLDLRRGTTKVRVRAGAPTARSMSDFVRVHVNRSGRARCAHGPGAATFVPSDGQAAALSDAPRATERRGAGAKEGGAISR